MIIECLTSCVSDSQTTLQLSFLRADVKASIGAVEKDLVSNLMHVMIVVFFSSFAHEVSTLPLSCAQRVNRCEIVPW